VNKIRKEILNGKYGEDDKGEVHSVNQKGMSTLHYTSMSDKALINLINFKVASRLKS
jgi:hypothetical protein